MAITDKANKVSNGSQPLPTTLSADKNAGVATASLNAATGWDITTAKHIRMFKTKTVNGQTVPDTTKLCYYKATLAGTTLSNITLVWSSTGSDQKFDIGDSVDLSLTAGWIDDLIDLILLTHNQNGTLKTGAVQAALSLGSESLSGWNPNATTPDTITNDGNHSQTLTFNGVDYSTVFSPGMRLRSSRTVTAPTQCTSLNGTSQYFSKSSPVGMTFTDDFAVSAWVKLSSYATTSGTIVGRFNGTSGWYLQINALGQVLLGGNNAIVTNFTSVYSYQSIPLNKWVHVAAQLDMSTGGVSPTTSYIMIDGTSVPAAKNSGGTNPTALIQAGNLEIGSINGGTQTFPGKIAQVAIYSAKVTQANIRLTMLQGLTGSETSLISAHSLSNSLVDLKVSNANNLTANGGALATSTDTPFSNGTGGILDYGIIQSVAFSTNTTVVVQMAEGNSIPTTGGVSAVAYSSQKVPYGFPAQQGKWELVTVMRAIDTAGIGSINAFAISNTKLTVPVGSWKLRYSGVLMQQSTIAGSRDGRMTLASSTPSVGYYLGEFTTVIYSAPSVGAVICSVEKKPSGSIDLSSQATYSMYGTCTVASGTEIWAVRGDLAEFIIVAENAFI